VRTVDAPTGLAVVAVDDSGENTIIVVPGANESVDTELIRESGYLDDAPTVVVQVKYLPPQLMS
jgi:ribokinase